MTNDRIRKRAEEVVYDYKLMIDRSKVAANIQISNEDRLIDLVEQAIREEVRHAIN